MDDQDNSLFGKQETRKQRRDSRKALINSNIRELKKIISGRGSKKFPDITRDSIGPKLSNFIVKSSNDEIVRALENAAFKLHTSLDRQPRVRVRVSEIDEILDRGYVRFDQTSQPQSTTGRPRRLERLIEDSELGGGE